MVLTRNKHILQISSNIIFTEQLSMTFLLLPYQFRFQDAMFRLLRMLKLWDLLTTPLNLN
jgi:hypothetical protein